MSIVLGELFACHSVRPAHSVPLHEMETVAVSDRPRILMVDDEPSTCQVLAMRLSRSGYEVECVHDASSALERLANEPFDLVLTDLMMEDMSGLDLLRRIRGADSDVPVIILTGHESLESAITATHLRVSDYLTKSDFSMQELLGAIEHALSEPPPG